MDLQTRIVMIATLVVAVMLHEIAHGLAALACGDPTARERGRLSLNPIRHIDPIGTIILPGILALAGSSVLFGWAKPVPVNLWRTRDPRQALWLTAIAGPATNLALAALAALALRVCVMLHFAPQLVVEILFFSVLINLVLLIFNMFPIPPLDGSRVVAALLPSRMAQSYLSIGKYGFLILFLLLRSDLFDKIMSPILYGLAAFLIPPELL